MAKYKVVLVFLIINPLAGSIVLWPYIGFYLIPGFFVDFRIAIIFSYIFGVISSILIGASVAKHITEGTILRIFVSTIKSSLFIGCCFSILTLPLFHEFIEISTFVSVSIATHVIASCITISLVLSFKTPPVVHSQFDTRPPDWMPWHSDERVR